MTLAWRCAWGRMHAPRGRDEIISYSRAYSARGKHNSSHTTGIHEHPFYSLFLFDSSTNLFLSFGKGDCLPYLRRSMNSAGRVTLFFLLIVLITQGKFHCIQHIYTFYKHKNFEKYYLLCASFAHWLVIVLTSSEKKSISSYSVSRELMNNHALAYPTKFVEGHFLISHVI